MSTSIQLSSLSSNEALIKLPHPYLAEYAVVKSQSSPQASDATASPTRTPTYQLRQTAPSKGPALPEFLTNDALHFSELASLKSSELPPQSNNSPWARARRSPECDLVWSEAEAPTLAQAWMVLYALFTVQPGLEVFRLRLRGPGAAVLRQQIQDVLLAVAHPARPQVAENAECGDPEEAYLLALRATFWQGAGSPFGPRPVWLPDESPAALAKPLASYPLTPLLHTLTVAPAGDPSNPSRYQQSWHPIRPAKPHPGAVIYSRWVPHLREMFSMVSLDYRDPEHLQLFHDWQNDPRVSQGWNETGTLDQHREYLRRMHEDPHQVAVLARFDDTFFAYFEIYWAKEDRLGSFYDATDFDRGRHSLVGDVRFRGPHRVTAWWSSLMHYLFLDDPRTEHVVGEPKETNNTVVAYDFMHGFGLDKFVDLPHKRSAFVRCSRERFFQLCPLGENEKVIGGMRIGLVPKL